MKLQVNNLTKLVISEIEQVLSSINENSIHEFTNAITNSNRIILHGVGRMGYVCAIFAMRLAQLGFSSHLLYESTTVSIQKGDLLILSSASGETSTVYDIAMQAKEKEITVALLTTNSKSRIANISDVIIILNAPNKLNNVDNSHTSSAQPLTTLTEQSVMILLDIIVMILIDETNQKSEDLWKRHRNLE